MTEWIRLAIRPSIRRRALRYAVGVGSVLIAINHGDAILDGDFSVGRVLRMILTVIVPYCVSTASAVSALQDAERSAWPATRSVAIR